LFFILKDFSATIALYSGVFYNTSSTTPIQKQFFVYLGSNFNLRPTAPLYQLPDLDQAKILPFQLREGILNLNSKFRIILLSSRDQKMVFFSCFHIYC
jgi:hypothetical protein